MPTFWEIDQFGAQHSNFEPWVFVSIQTDENGEIAWGPVPGLPFLAGDHVSDYHRNNRRYTSEQLITEFCNLDTHVNYRIYAKDELPFVYVQTDINAAKCGYLTPPPEPFKPPTPFGTPTYGFYAYHNFCDINGVAINIKIYKRNYTGEAIKINNSGETPVIISYKNTDDNKFNPIRSCELQLTLVSSTTFSLEQLYTQDEREFKVEVIKGGIQKFIGFGTAEEASEDFVASPYDLVWRATDGLGALKNIDYPIPFSSGDNITQNFIEILCYCLAMTNLNLNIATICNLYDLKMLNGLGDDPLAQAIVNPLRLIDNNKVLSCYAVLEKICYQFGAFLVQNNGVWHFIRQSELSNTILRKRSYNYTGLLLKSEQFFNKRVATCKGTDIIILDDSPTLRIGNAYKKAEVVLDFGNNGSPIYNGNFETYANGNWPGWAKYGGIDVLRIEKQIITTTGTVPSGDFAILFNKPADVSKYIQAAKIPITLNDKITLTFNAGQSIVIPGNLLPPFKIRIKLGEYYLYNPNNDDNYTWVSQVTTCNVNILIKSNVLDSCLVTMAMPPAPKSDYMYIQIFGLYYFDLKVYIDNITIAKATNDKIGRILYVSQQDGFYTTVPDQIVILFGDTDALPTDPVPQYAIKNTDGSYTSSWYEYGNSAKAAPIGLVLAKTIMKAYQVPFRFLQSSFLGNNISYLDIFNVYLPNNTDFNNRIFALLSGDFNLSTGEVKNANYVEIFSKPGKTTDIAIVGYIGDPSPPINQNPNPTAITTDRIFTEEFTNQFK